MSQSFPPENSMKALMDAVDQARVDNAQSSARAFAFPFTDLNSSSPVKMGGKIAPHPNHSTPINMGGMIDNQGGPLRKRNHNSVLSEANAVATKGTSKKARTTDQHDDDEKRRQRLEQSQRAANWRRRKKHMEEELKRSVSFYTKANTSLRSQNAELERQLLIAKEKALVNQEENKAESKGTKDDSTSVVKGGPQNAAEKESSPLRDSKPEAKASEPSTIVPVSNGIACSTLFGNAPDADLEKQAQQAQFAATQALYKIMGYPARAARDAASTFTQDADLTGVVPGLSAAPPTSNMVAAMPSESGGAAACSPLIPVSRTSPPPETEADDDSAYIKALNRFAMQQAAAANAAAAAATAAIQAAHLYDQLKKKGSSSPSSSNQVMASTLPFSYPAGGMMWPFQNQVSFPKFD